MGELDPSVTLAMLFTIIIGQLQNTQNQINELAEVLNDHAEALELILEVFDEADQEDAERSAARKEVRDKEAKPRKRKTKGKTKGGKTRGAEGVQPAKESD